MVAQLDGLLTLGGDTAATIPADNAVSSGDVSGELEKIVPLVERLAARIDALRTESAVLPLYVELLRRLLPLVPELDESEMHAAPGVRARPQHV